jgi:hypothetical protein
MNTGTSAAHWTCLGPASRSNKQTGSLPWRSMQLTRLQERLAHRYWPKSVN